MELIRGRLDQFSNKLVIMDSKIDRLSEAWRSGDDVAQEGPKVCELQTRLSSLELLLLLLLLYA